jgi:hypothetical protein
VKALAPRTAIMTASVPELAKRTFSTDVTRAMILSASSACSSAGAGKTVPKAACSIMASFTAGTAWPWIEAV